MALTLLLVLAGCAHGPTATPARCKAVQRGQYFPAGAFSEQDAFTESWYGEQLCAMNEESLARRPVDEAYRFLWLRSFHHPVAVRIELSRGSASLVAVELNGTGGDEPGGIERRAERTLSAQEWTSLVAAVDGAHFWEAPKDDPSRGVEDGAEWIFEGRRPGTYHMITRRSPEGGPVRSLGETFLDTARLSFPGKEVY